MSEMLTANELLLKLAETPIESVLIIARKTDGDVMIASRAKDLVEAFGMLEILRTNLQKRDGKGETE